MIEKFTLSGVVHPQRACFGVDSESPDIITWNNGKQFYKLHYSFKASVLTVNLEIENRIGNYWDIRNLVKSLLQKQIDARGFDVNAINQTSVLGLDLEIVSLVDLDKGEHFNFLDIEHIFEKGKAPQLPDNFRVHAIQNDALSLALSCFRKAIRQPDETAYLYYRAIEAIASEFRKDKSPQVKLVKADWDAFREALNLDRATIDRYEAQGIVRHGRMIFQTWEERKDQLLIAWNIIYRFGMYLENGQTKLSPETYKLF